MRAVTRRPDKTSQNYEIATLFISGVVSGLGVPFYIEATKKAEWYEKSSSIVANTLINFFVTKDSIDYLASLIKKGEYAKATGIIITAAVLYAPQILISVMESNYPLGFTVFAAVATGLSGSFFSAYAVAQMPGLASAAKRKIAGIPDDVRKWCGTLSEDDMVLRADKKNVINNLEAIAKRMRVSDYRAVDLTSAQVSFTRQQLLDLCMTLAQTAQQPCVENAGCLPSVAKQALSSTLIAALLFGTLFSYGCGTEKSLRDDFKVPPLIAFIAGLVLLSFQYLLNVTGGYGLAASIVDSLSLLNFGRILPNEKKLGGALGTAVVVAAPALAIISSSFSGKPSKEFSATCESSISKPWLFNGFDSGVDYSARFFNAIFAAKFFYWVCTYGVKRNGSEQDQNFLFLLNELRALIATVKATSANEIEALFQANESPLVAIDAVEEQPLANNDAAAVVTIDGLKLPRENFDNRFFRADLQHNSDDPSQAFLPSRTASNI